MVDGQGSQYSEVTLPRRSILKGISGGMAAGVSGYLGRGPYQPQTEFSKAPITNQTSTRQAFVTLPDSQRSQPFSIYHG